MGLFNFFRRKKQTTVAPRLREIWKGFQEILASNNEVQGIIGSLEEMLTGQKEPDLAFLNSRVWVLDQHFVSMVAALYPAQLAARMVPATALRSNF